MHELQNVKEHIMKITKKVLRQIVNEEVAKMNEQRFAADPPPRTPMSKDYPGDRTFSYDEKRGKHIVPGVDDWVDAREGEAESRKQTQRADQSDPGVVDALKTAEWAIGQAQGLIEILLDKIEAGGKGMPEEGGFGGGDAKGIIHWLRRAEFNLKKAAPQ